MIKNRRSHGVAILTFNTPLMQTEPSILLIKGNLLDALLGEIDKQYNQNYRRILINLTNVVRIDEDAFAELLGKRSKDQIRICFFDMQRSVRNVLKNVPKLPLVFDVYNSEKEAIESFT